MISSHHYNIPSELAAVCRLEGEDTEAQKGVLPKVTLRVVGPVVKLPVLGLPLHFHGVRVWRE